MLGRKFDESTASRPTESTELLARIGQLYRVEALCKEMDPEERYTFRQKHARPIVDTIFRRLEELSSTTIPSEPLRRAINYALNQRQALYRYLDDGRLKPDNNTAENAIRPLALGRKNWLFVESCKACEVNPWEYFNDVLGRIMGHPVKQLRQLLPDQWRPLPN